MWIQTDKYSGSANRVTLETETATITIIPKDKGFSISIETPGVDEITISLEAANRITIK